MTTMLVTIVMCTVLIGLFFVMLGIRIIFNKEGGFRGSCASNNPLLMQTGIDCACGKKPGECQTGVNADAQVPMPSIK
jgi:hypothetical protein